MIYNLTNNIFAGRTLISHNVKRQKLQLQRIPDKKRQFNLEWRFDSGVELTDPKNCQGTTESRYKR